MLKINKTYPGRKLALARKRSALFTETLYALVYNMALLDYPKSLHIELQVSDSCRTAHKKLKSSGNISYYTLPFNTKNLYFRHFFRAFSSKHWLT